MKDILLQRYAACSDCKYCYIKGSTKCLLNGNCRELICKDFEPTKINCTDLVLKIIEKAEQDKRYKYNFKNFLNYRDVKTNLDSNDSYNYIKQMVIDSRKACKYKCESYLYSIEQIALLLNHNKKNIKFQIVWVEGIYLITYLTAEEADIICPYVNYLNGDSTFKFLHRHKDTVEYQAVWNKYFKTSRNREELKLG